MPYVDDLVSSGLRSAEVSTSEITGVNILQREVASQLFPSIELPTSENLAFLEFVFCNSMPKRNKRGRTFTPKVLSNSFASLNDQLIDYEHLLDANGINSKGDRIIGHVKATRFNLPTAIEKASAREIASLTDPIPAYGLGVLFMRAAGVDRIVENKGKRPWKTSMECGHSWSDAYFLYENEFIPVKEAEIAMRDCVSATAVKDFKSRQLTVCLGGLEGKVDFWGLGLTQSPADGAADILSIMSGRGPELASKNIFYMPMFSFSENSVEVASEGVDKRIEEWASISIIGETCPDCEGGHTHQILSNLQTLPANGHSHSSHDIHVSRGSNPKVTGVTDTHSVYPSDGSSGNRHEHRHLIDISLKGKYPKESDDSDIASTEKEARMAKTLEELLPQFESLIGKINMAGDGADKKNYESELASLRTEITKLNGDKAIADAVKTAIDAEVASGKLVTKEVAEQAVADATKKVKDELEEQNRIAGIRNARHLKAIENNVNLDVEFEGVLSKDDGKPMTLRKRIDMIPVDDAGNQQFDMDLSVWAKTPDLLKEAPVVTEATPVAEAANTGKAKAAAKPARISLVGGSSTTKEGKEGEEANENTSKPIPAHLQGRRAHAKS